MNKKVAINTCFGGFRLSLKGELMYYKLKGIDVFVYEHTKYEHRDGIDEYRKVIDLDRVFDSNNYIDIKLSQNDLGEIAYNVPFKEFLHLDYSDMSIREDENIIEVIETLGVDAESSVSNIRVVEVPSYVSYSIEEYDGREKLSLTI